MTPHIFQFHNYATPHHNSQRLVFFRLRRLQFSDWSESRPCSSSEFTRSTRSTLSIPNPSSQRTTIPAPNSANAEEYSTCSEAPLAPQSQALALAPPSSSSSPSPTTSHSMTSFDSAGPTSTTSTAFSSSGTTFFLFFFQFNSSSTNKRLLLYLKVSIFCDPKMVISHGQE